MQSWSAPEIPRIPDSGGDPAVLVPDSTTGTLVQVPGAVGEDVRVYVCGITPYDATHLGHAATYLLFDLLNRTCLDAGRPVRFVQNVTDVDDPLLERATATGVDWQELALTETQRFREDMAALRVLPPEAFVGAVEAIPQIAESVRQLLDAGAAYHVEDDIYFSVAATGHFGEVCGLDVATMLRLSAERGGDPDRSGKKDPLDPLLWRSERPDEPSWETDLGAGRPGWHIECATIALRHLGETIHVQGGGEDLLFPHHEFSAQHASCLTGIWPFAVTNVHQALIAYDGEKMSKSRGNLVFISRLRGDGVDPMAIRLALLAHSSREPWEFHDSELGAAAKVLTAWRAGFTRRSGPAAGPLIAAVRHALRTGLDAPAAVSAVTSWATADGPDEAAPAAAARAVDALLGVV